MDIRKGIFDERRRVDGVRQPTYTMTVQQLCSVLQARKREHPYSLTRDDYKDLMHDGAFSRGANGPQVRPSSAYLYRLISVGTLIDSTDWKRRVVSAAQTYDDIARASTPPDAWLKLSRWAKGTYCNPRRFSWWTDHDLEAEQNAGQIVRAYRKLGLLDDWIVDRSMVLLRCRTEDVATHVPSVIDAFPGLVFEAVPEHGGPQPGRTIDLGATPFAPGAAEFVCCEIPVEKIEFRAAHIVDTDKEHSGSIVRDEPATWDRLLRYYALLQ